MGLFTRTNQINQLGEGQFAPTKKGSRNIFKRALHKLAKRTKSFLNGTKKVLTVLARFIASILI